VDCLTAIFKLNYPKEFFQVILVDNGSTDGTLNFIRDFDVRSFICPEMTISALRNHGAKNSKGSLLAFLDSDCVVPENWLRNAIILFRERGIGVVGCGYGLPQDAGWVLKAWYLPASESSKEVSFIPAGNMVVPRNIFDSIQGFDERLITGEDYDLCQRVRDKGYRIMASKLVQVVHLDSADSLFKFLKKERWYGKGMLPSFNRATFFNKTIIFCHLFGFCIIAIVLSLVFFSGFVFIASLILLIFILVISVTYRIFVKADYKDAKKFIPLMVLYFMYYLGRAYALADLYKEALKKYLESLKRKYEAGSE